MLTIAMQMPEVTQSDVDAKSTAIQAGIN